MTTDNTNPHPRRRRSLRDLLLTAVTTAMILCGVSACVDLPDSLGVIIEIGTHGDYSTTV